MRSFAIFATVFGIFTSEAMAQHDDRIQLAQRTVDSEYVEPFKVFDNLYYVGINWVGAWIIETSDGLIMIDALYGEFVEPLLKNIRKLGFDPADIKYVFGTHGHFDHIGGVKDVKDVSDARIGMTEADWTMYHASASGRFSYETIPTDLVVKDGDSITLGDTTLKFYVTPGHTPGVLSMEFTVYDGAKAHKAFLFGGVGLNFSGVDRCRMYVNSVERIMAMDGLEVNVPNHASMGKVFERAEKLKLRKEGEPHPFVAPDEYAQWLKGLMVNVQAKLAKELDRVK